MIGYLYLNRRPVFCEGSSCLFPRKNEERQNIFEPDCEASDERFVATGLRKEAALQ